MLLRSNELMSETLAGNCGVNVVFRLAASYVKDENSREEYKRQVKNGLLRPIRIGNNHTISIMLENLRDAEGGAAIARAYPLEWAFAETVEAFHYGTYAMVCMTDTEHGAGDGHEGIYATRHFADWLLSGNLASGHRTTSIRHPDSAAAREVYGWFLVPDKERIESYLASMRDTIRAAIEEYNDEPSIKESETKERSEEETIAAAIGEGFDVERLEAAAQDAILRGGIESRGMPQHTTQAFTGARRQGATFNPGFEQAQRWYAATPTRVDTDAPVEAAEPTPPPSEQPYRGLRIDQVVVDEAAELDELLDQDFDEYPEDIDDGEEYEF